MSLFNNSVLDDIPLSQSIWSNSGAVDFIIENIHSPSINWKMVCLNKHPRVIELLENHLDKIEWYFLSKNGAAIDLLYKHRTKIITHKFWENENNQELIDYACNYIYNHERSIYVSELGLNQYYYDLFIETICINTNEHVMQMLYIMLNEDPYVKQKVNWTVLSANPSAIDILKQYPEKIKWREFSKNHAIFNSQCNDGSYVFK
jgi:hypothetical protein